MNETNGFGTKTLPPTDYKVFGRLTNLSISKDKTTNYTLQHILENQPLLIEKVFLFTS